MATTSDHRREGISSAKYIWGPGMSQGTQGTAGNMSQTQMHVVAWQGHAALMCQPVGPFHAVDHAPPCGNHRHGAGGTGACMLWHGSAMQLSCADRHMGSLNA
jgi:hypothetical protein